MDSVTFITMPDEGIIKKQETASIAARGLVLLLLLLIPWVGRAQCDKSTMGKDFWVMFLSNFDTEEYSLLAACDHGTTIHVENPYTHWNTTAQISDSGGCIRITIPPESAITNYFAQVNNGGIHVTSDHPIALYASNFFPHSYDIATVYPTSTLRSQYRVQTYGEESGNEVGIVATEDNTELSMVFSPDNIPITNGESGEILPGMHCVTLMQGQTYQIYGLDYSGMMITSNDKPFAMFQGNFCTNVGGECCCDHLYEQSYPVDYWGKLFMLVSTAERSLGDLVKITSLEDSCVLYIDNTQQTTLQAGGSYLYNLPSNSVRLLRSTKPVSVISYLKSCGNDYTALGDPASVTIPPVEQGVSSTVFQALNTETTTKHFANIVTPTGAVPYMKLDGVSISSSFTVTTYGYAYARLSVMPGLHTLSCSNGTFVAYFYGLGLYESYAYIAGSAINDLTEKLYVDGHYTREYSGSFNYCPGDTAHLWIESDEKDLSVDWLVDSVLMVTDDSLFNFYCETSGYHLVQAAFHTCDTLSALLYIHENPKSILVDSLCIGDTYRWRNYIISTEGTYYDTVPNDTGCDSVYILNLSFIQRPEGSFHYASDCQDSTYTLIADLEEEQNYPFIWSSIPHDPSLDGHEHDTAVIVKPSVTTLYSLTIDFYCPFRIDKALMPIAGSHAAWEINPEYLSYEHPWFDAYDKSTYVMSRQWFVDQQLISDDGDHLYYQVPIDKDSVEVMLIINPTTCPDSIQCTLPFSYASCWAPNVFTPDAESNNRFSVHLNEGVAEELYIYNRNGLLVSKIEGTAFVWDGTHNGEPCPQGAYVWLLRYYTDVRPAERRTLTGTVTLLR